MIMRTNSDLIKPAQTCFCCPDSISHRKLWMVAPTTEEITCLRNIEWDEENKGIKTKSLSLSPPFTHTLTHTHTHMYIHDNL